MNSIKIKGSIRKIALVLSITMFMTLLQSFAFNSIFESAKAQSIPIKVLGELENKRDRFTKVFLQSDGSEVSITSAQALNYKLNGKWEDIDNTLISDKDEAGDDVFVNSKSSYKVKLPKVLKQGKPVVMEKEGYKLSFSLKDSINSSIANKKENAANPEEKSEAKKLSKLETKSSEVSYSNVKNSNEIKYYAMPEQLKEEIILNNKPTEAVSYTYEITAYGLTPKILEDKSIEFYNDKNLNEPIFIIPAPFMYDKENVISNDIEVSFVESGKDTYTLTYLPLFSWLNDGKRVYPVAIDPSVQTTKDTTNVDDASVFQSNPNTNYGSSSTLNLVCSSSDKQNFFIKFNTLPSLSSGYIINSAKVSLCRVSSGSAQIDAYQVTQSWSEYSITWNNSPSISNVIHDSQLSNILFNYSTWDITNTTRDWYLNGNNYGLRFKLHDEVSMSFNSLASSENTFIPYMEIKYTNATGLESYWDYHTQNIGRAGNVSVNDYSGNLVLQQEQLGITGNRLPVDIQRIYNTNDKDTNIGYGYGYRTNYNRTITAETISGVNYYKYVDEDGTRHYFVYDSTDSKWKDQSGKNLVLETAGNYSPNNQQYRLTDSSGMKYLFDTNGRLTYIQDNNTTPNQIAITYYSTSEKITSITDGAGRIYNFTYTSDNTLLQKIDYMDSNNFYVLKTVSYTYTANSDLETVTFPDDAAVNYTWLSGHKLDEAKDIDNSKVKYSYNSAFKVTDIDLFGTNGTAGMTLDIVYGNNQTTFTDINQLKEIKQFNNSGNTVSVRDEKGNAKFGRYAESGDTNYKPNQLVKLSSMQNTAVNLIKNYSFEDTDTSIYSTYSDGGTGTAVWNDTASLYIGSKSMSIEKTASDDAGPYGKRCQVTVPTDGKTYTFSVWVKTTGFSNATTGAYISISHIYNSTETKVNSKAITTNADWQKIDATITVPTATNGTCTLKFYLCTGDVGKVYFDCLQAGETKTGSSPNFVENADFTNQGSSTDNAYMWTGENLTAGNDIRTTESTERIPLDTNCYKITGETNKAKRIYQDILISGSSEDSFTVSGWAKAFAVPLVYTGNSSTDKDFAIKVTVYNGATAVENYRFPFNAQSNDWQYMADTFKTSHAYTKIQVSFVYYNQCNTAYFDGVELCKENFGNSYAYDANGNLTAATDKNGSTTSIAYDANNNPDTITDAASNTTDFNINASKQLLDTTSDEGVKSVFTYDDFGNTLTYIITNNTLSIETATTFDENGNYVDKVTDPLGKTTDYDYNAELGTLDKVKDANGKTTSYGYDAMGKMTSVSKDVSGLFGKNSITTVSNGYTYSNDKLSAITHNGFNYNFSYDVMGNLTNVKAGTQDLITNTYKTDDKTYNLSNVAFGNSQSIQYSYDKHNNLTNVTRDGNYSNSVFTYQYDNTDVLLNKTDYINNLFTSFGYDSAHRVNLTTETKKDGNGNIIYYHSYGNEFNSINLISKFLETLNGTAFETAFAYNGDNKLTSSTFNYVSGTNKGRKSISYDTLGRISTTSLSKIVSDVPTQFAGTSYSYKNLPNNKTTNQIESMTLSGGSGGNAYSWIYGYTYDNVGNIKTQSKNSTLKQSYTYDQLGQLIRVDDADANKSYTYSYDIGGNIREKKEYAFTTGTLGTPTATISYGYTDTNWNDKLTSYNGNTISYDNIGNMTAFNGRNFTWHAGRQLSGTNGTGLDTTSYKYNDSGYRTQKTVGSVVTNYTLVEDRVTAETNGTDTIYYRYDGNNDLISMNLNGTEYFHLRNLQNDIIALLDDSGAIVVEYQYDSWGKLLHIKDANGNEITDTSSVGFKNPYRYRGYRYDTETGLFYVGSRYYNPEIGRFINADDTAILQATQGQLLSHNLFSYCLNNPVMYSDPSGYAAIKWYWYGYDILFSKTEATKLLIVLGALASLAALIAGISTVFPDITISKAVAAFLWVTRVILVLLIANVAWANMGNNGVRIRFYYPTIYGGAWRR